MRAKLIIAILLVSFYSFSQDKNLIINQFNLETIQYNPAVGYNCNFLRLPIISGVYLDLHHTGFAYNDIFVQTDQGYKINLTNLKQKVTYYNFLLSELRITDFAIGFKIKKLQAYISAGVNTRASFIFGYPDDYITVFEGNARLAGLYPIDLMPYINIIAFNEVYFSYSKQVKKDLRLGFRIKILQGISSAYLNNSYAQIYTNPETYDLNIDAKINFNMSFPITVQFDTNSFPTAANLNITNPIKDFIFNGNYGLAIDFGIIKRLSPKLTVQFALNDLGFIHWKSNVLNYSGTGSYIFKGLNIDINQLSKDFNAAINAAVQQELNQIQQSYSLTYGYNPFYSSNIPYVRFYIGAIYQIKDFLSLNVLLRNSIFNNYFYQSITFGPNLILLNKHLILTLIGSYMDRTINNIGGALTLNLKPLQFFVATDNLLAFNNLRTTRNIGLQAGINFIFNCYKKSLYPTGKKKGHFVRPPDLCPAYDTGL